MANHPLSLETSLGAGTGVLLSHLFPLLPWFPPPPPLGLVPPLMSSQSTWNRCLLLFHLSSASLTHAPVRKLSSAEVIWHRCHLVGTVVPASCVCFTVSSVGHVLWPGSDLSYPGVNLE